MKANQSKLLLTVVDRPIEEIRPNSNSARDHSPAQMRKLRAAIREFGLVQPILIDERSTVIAGNARLEAAKDLSIARVPCIILGHLSEAEQRAYALADNRIAEEGTWNQDRLGKELRFLAEQNLSFELDVTGFETAELDFHLVDLEPSGRHDSNTVQTPGTTADPDGALADGEGANETSESRAETVPPTLLDTSTPPITQPGDLWFCGPHRLLCGDALSAEDLDRLMAGAKADMVFTDPPYNVPVVGHVRGRGAGHREFVEASGEMSSADFTVFLSSFMANAISHSSDGALHYICMDWRHIEELLAAAKPHYRELLNLCIWNKTNGGMGSFYRSKHELVFVWKVGTAAHRNNIQLGKFGRYRTNVWDYAGVNSFGGNREADLIDHPTVKPTNLVLDAILDCTKRGEFVLDPFMGSGTTLLAAERSGRIAYGVEKDPRYVDVALRRWQELTGDQPVHALTGETWSDRLAELSETSYEEASSSGGCVMSEHDSDYEVGYGRPPKSSQFKKGQSGNPKGRPKGAKSLRGHIKQLLDAKMTISDAKGQRKVSTRKAMAMRIIKKAIDGDPKAIQVAMTLDQDFSEDLALVETPKLTETELRLVDELFGDNSPT